jgi:membrane protease YdiL (CAAX protease family)
MIISALIFSASHVSVGVLVPIFITSVLLAWLYQQTGSLWTSVIAHAGQNAAALLATIYGI